MTRLSTLRSTPVDSVWRLMASALTFDERAHTIELKPRVDARLAAGAIAF